MSKSISCCPLTSKSTDIINYNCFRLWQNFSFFSCTLLGQCLFLFWFRQDDFFHWIKLYNRLVFYLEVMVWSSKYLIDNFVYYKHFFFFYFIRHSLMDWSHEDYLWIILMFLSAVWTLVLMVPIHCIWTHWQASGGMLNFSKCVPTKEQIHLHPVLSEGRYIFFLGWTINLTSKV